MRGAAFALTAAAVLWSGLEGAAVAQGVMASQGAAVRFDRPLFTTAGAALCPRQHQIAALRRALDDKDRSAFDSAAKEGGCTLVGPGIRLAVVARPGSRDPDVEVRVVEDTPGGGRLPRGKVWTLKAMVLDHRPFRL